MKRKPENVLEKPEGSKKRKFNKNQPNTDDDNRELSPADR